MNTKFKKATRILGAFAILGALLACGGSSDDSSGSTTTSTTTGAQPTGEQAQGVVAAQPGAGPTALQLGQPAVTMNVPAPPAFSIDIAAPGEYQLDVTAGGNDPKMWLYQGDTLVEDNDDGGDGNNARIVRFLTPGNYQIRVTEFRARQVTVQGQAQLLQALAPVATLTLGAPSTVEFPDVGFMNRPRNNRDASRGVNFTVAAPGQYTCSASMSNDRRVKIQLINVSTSTSVAEADQGFRQNEATITQQLQPGEYQLRVWDSIYRGETTATINCRQG